MTEIELIPVSVSTVYRNKELKICLYQKETSSSNVLTTLLFYLLFIRWIAEKSMKKTEEEGHLFFIGFKSYTREITCRFKAFRCTVQKFQRSMHSRKYKMLIKFKTHMRKYVSQKSTHSYFVNLK